MAARYVVDASVLAHDLNPDRYTAEAANLLSGLVDGHELYIPEFCLLECTNVLWKQVRFNGFPQVDAESIIADFLDLPFQVVAVYLLLPNALKIALSHGLAVYDSLYIALALELGCPLASVDNRQVKAALASGVTLKPIADFSDQ